MERCVFPLPSSALSSLPRTDRNLSISLQATKKAPAKAKKEKEPVEATRRQPRRGAAENAKKVIDDDFSESDDEEPLAESDEEFSEDEAPKKRGAKVRLAPSLPSILLLVDDADFSSSTLQKAGKKAPPKKKAKTSQ